MVKKNSIAYSLALATIVSYGFPILAQSETPSDDKAEVAKAKVAIEHKDYSTALKLLKPLAEQQGLRSAEYHLALMYLEGQGVAKDPKIAAELFKRRS